MSTAILKNIQVGQDADPLKNFTLRVPVVADGTLEIRRGNANAPGALLAKVNADGGLNTCGPVFHATRSATQLVTQNIQTKLVYTSEVTDTNNCYDAPNSRFQPNVAGWYWIAASTSSDQPGNTYSYLQLWKNGASAIEGTTSSGNGIYWYNVCGIIYLNGTTDYVDVIGNGTGTNWIAGNAAHGNYFQGYLVRAA
jgi:hypothetical protein